jgi:hypothetical protein
MLVDNYFLGESAHPGTVHPEDCFRCLAHAGAAF